MDTFETPDFLANRSTDDFFEKMKEILPDDIDLSEGGHAWNFTRPTALVAAEISEFVLPEVIKLIFPKWSYGEFLDGHAEARGITRKPATAATGEITITGEADTIIPEGSLFSTASVNGSESVDYKTLAAAKIPASGSVTVRIQCTKTGTVGNTPVNTIILVAGRNTGITAVTNESAVTGGTEPETDDSLKERIAEYDKSQGESYTGNASDYRRWAMSVPGVGDATVIPAKDDTGLITIIVTDANGQPATEELLTAVYNYIMRPDDEGSRLAPPNANLSVVAPSTIAICVKATVELEDGATIESVQTDFLARLAAYLPAALDDGEVKYSSVYALLTATEGVNDHTGLQIGSYSGESVVYGTSNITVTESQLPTVSADDLVLTAGTV